MSPYFPIGNGIVGGLYLPAASGNYASTPDESGLDITGDIDIRVRAKLPEIPGTRILASKFAAAGNQRSWVFRTNADGKLQFHFYADGISAVDTHVSDALTSPVGWFRVTLDVDDGDGGYAVNFYTAPDDPQMPTEWEHKGTSTGTGTTSIFNSSAPLSIGNDGGGFTGTFAALTVYRLQLRNGIDGTIVADPKFTNPVSAWTVDKTTRHDGYRLWTINGSRWEWRP